jgi:alkylhydroperoxidase/carboxymuconolactone decarboxylase family protein YurZ
MALQDITKSTLASLATLLSQDMALNVALRSSAERLLPPDDALVVIANLCARNANGASIGAAQVALDAIASDIAAG